MKVILLEDIKSLGRKFDVKNISDGYARNFLLPKKMVQIATPAALAQLKIQKEIQEKARAKQLENLKKIAASLKGQELIFALKVGDKGEVFGSVNVDKISEAFKAKGFEVEKNQIELESPLKSLGEHLVSLKLDKEIEAKIKIKIEAEN